MSANKIDDDVVNKNKNKWKEIESISINTEMLMKRKSKVVAFPGYPFFFACRQYQDVSDYVIIIDHMYHKSFLASD